MENIVIKSLPADEWKKYKEIRLEALKTSPEAFSNRYEEAAEFPDEKWQKQLELSERREGVILLFAFDGDKVIGMNGCCWTNKPVLRHIADVFGVYVNPAYRGQGIGRKLMESVIGEIKKDPKFKKIKLGVNAENTAAKSLYENCGLQVVGRLKDELNFGEKFCDELLMEMLIK